MGTHSIFPLSQAETCRNILLPAQARAPSRVLASVSENEQAALSSAALVAAASASYSPGARRHKGWGSSRAAAILTAEFLRSAKGILFAHPRRAVIFP